MPEEILVASYNSEWPKMYETTKQTLVSVVGNHIEDIQHVGSTAVPGLGAKPIIDIMIGVSSLSKADAHCIQPIVECGFECKIGPGPRPRRYFTKDDADGNRTHQIHLVEITSEWWESHILFRDYLRAHDEVRDNYEQLKHELAEETYARTSDYADRKTEFITGVVEQARMKI